MSIYSTKAMAAAMRQNKKLGQFLLDMFFAKVDPRIGKTVEIDIIKGKRRMAPFQTPRVEGKLIEKLGFSTREYKPAYVKPKQELNAIEMTDNRSAGESAYSLQSPQEREKQALSDQLNDLEDMISRREEWMCAQQLVNGYVDVVGEGVNYRVDLGMEASHKITVTTLWTDIAAKPMSDIGDAIALISQDAGISANVVLGNSDTIELFLNSPDTKDKLNTRRIELGQISPEQYGENATYYGDVFIKGKKMQIWSYDEWYIDDASGNELPMLPDGKVVVTSTNADFRRHYGSIKDKKAGYAALPRFPKTWDQEDPDITWIMVQSAPLPAAHQIDAICVLSVL